ncbi:amino acid transporter [Metschnikowia bicuspidata var. bicuspidata NRRL YB-4993]|uniref:Amino acid transporter n=1 Tax=Metschnikowia bicuspidata var. bicuspidata NRRL YB-4993 TaxID=869754 RepID=A0A1A0H842_9ASCO|nr:amino acid transporter [Metschnikowia bicuspidata var. bicuspidata NRRL YB-4993]OBA20155.1 amino acid transporter [Metschnikowia bicuspidata var. bicuspidata NRRL YB-4993]
MSSEEKKSENSENNFSNVEDFETNAAVNIDQNKKDIGVFSAVFLVTNRIIGAGVFSTASTILSLSGSVGTSMILWVVGSIIAFTGLLSYMELGSAIPRNGGEKNYLEYIYTKPKLFVTAMYASYIFFLGWAAGNSIVTGEYLLNAAGKEVTQWNSRAIGIGVITFAFLINGLHVKSGLLLANVLGVFKVAIIVFISITGWVALAGGIKNDNFTDPHNFTDSFSGTTPTGYGIVNALYNIIWSYVGYSNANYALGEIKNPIRVLKIAAPSALFVITILYIFVNIAYFAVVPADEIRSSGRIVVASFFKYAFGETAETASSVFVALSTLGNVLSVIFSQGRIIQQLGREGSLPFSRFFATSKPFNSPFVGLFQHWIVCIVTIIAPPPGDAYNFILNLISYPLNVVNTFVAIGLLYLKYKSHKGEITWNPPIRAPFSVVFFFALSSLYLIVAPYIPPSAGQSVYNSLPYWIHPVVTWAIFGIGAVYWAVWAKLLPRIGGYTVVVKEVMGSDGFWRNKFIKVPHGVDPDKFAEEAINEDAILND